MRISDPLFKHLNQLGFTVLFSQFAPGLLDLLAVEHDQPFYLGPLGLIISGDPVLPCRVLGVPAGNLGDMATSCLPADQATEMLRGLVAAMGGKSVSWVPTTGHMSFQFRSVTKDLVSPEDLAQYLNQATRLPSSLTKQLGRLFVVTELLKAGEVVVFTSHTGGLPVQRDWTAFAQQTGLQGRVEPSSDGYLLHGPDPAVFGFRCLELACGTGRFDLAHFGSSVIGGGVLRPFESRGGQFGGIRQPLNEGEFDYREYIVVPERGLHLDPERQPEVARLFVQMHELVGIRPVETGGDLNITVEVVDSISVFGPKLVLLRTPDAVAVNTSYLGWRVRPVVYYRLETAPSFELYSGPAHGDLTVNLVCARTAQGVGGAEVIAITDWTNHVGARAMSNRDGEVLLALGKGPVTVERLFVKPPVSGFWGAFRKDTTLRRDDVIQLEPAEAGYTDHLRHMYPNICLLDGQGVKVGVIDAGVGPHPDLVVSGGRNVLRTESPTCFNDNGSGHGTHVAGIIAARGTPPHSIRGLAPAIELYSYRVFAANSTRLRNFDLVKALHFAQEQCDIINMSVGCEEGQAVLDPTLEDAIKEARDYGCVLVAAAGNGGRKAVGLIGVYVGAEGLCVSAGGRRGTFPAGSLEESDADANPAGLDPNDFVAAFSNVGPDVNLIAPGVGILSTAVNKGIRPLSGTSMAAPAVAGYVARVLGKNASLLTASRDGARARAVLKVVLNHARSLGFPSEFQGKGILQ